MCPKLPGIISKQDEAVHRRNAAMPTINSPTPNDVHSNPTIYEHDPTLEQSPQSQTNHDESIHTEPPSSEDETEPNCEHAEWYGQMDLSDLASGPSYTVEKIFLPGLESGYPPMEQIIKRTEEQYQPMLQADIDNYKKIMPKDEWDTDLLNDPKDTVYFRRQCLKVPRLNPDHPHHIPKVDRNASISKMARDTVSHMTGKVYVCPLSPNSKQKQEEMLRPSTPVLSDLHKLHCTSQM